MALSVSKDKLITLVVVLFVHSVALYWATRLNVLPPVPTPKEVAMQAVVIMPVALPTKPVEPLPQPTPSKPVQPKEQPQPIVQKTPVLPPSEKAIMLEKTVMVEKNEPIVEKVSPTNVVNEPPVVSKVEAAPEPEPVVIPPRSDASGLNNTSPTYPAMSRRLAEQGKVLLEVLILANGTVGEIKLKQSSGFKRLDDAALQTVKQWRFQPAKRGNQAIDYWYIQPISFSLDT